MARTQVQPYDNPENWAKACQWDDLLRARTLLSRLGMEERKR